jgi:hypothetical protein
LGYGPLDDFRSQIAHQPAYELALARQSGAASQALCLDHGVKELGGQSQMLELCRTQQRELHTELLQGLGATFALRTAQGVLAVLGVVIVLFQRPARPALLQLTVK